MTCKPPREVPKLVEICITVDVERDRAPQGLATIDKEMMFSCPDLSTKQVI